MSALLDELGAQLHGLARQQTYPFATLIEDYQRCLERAHEAEVRVAQLDKEAVELRAENDTLLQSFSDLQTRSVSRAEHNEVQTRISALQAQLADAYREKALLAESSLNYSEQLGVVRDINDQQNREIESAKKTERELRSQVESLRGRVEQLEESMQMAGQEAESRRSEAEEAVAELEVARGEQRDLERRLVQMREQEAERMNAVNRECEQLLRSAREKAREMVLQATQATASGSGAVSKLELKELGLKPSDLRTSPKTVDDTRKVPELPNRLVFLDSLAHTAGCFGLALSGSGAKLASCGADGLVKVWDALPRNGVWAPPTVLRGCHKSANAVAWSGDNRSVIAAESGAALRVWSSETGRLFSSLTGHTRAVTGVAAAPGPGSNALVSCSEDRTLKLWSLSRGLCRRTILCASGCNAVGWAERGAKVASVHFDGNLRLWDAETGQQVNECAGLHSDQICALDIDQAGGALLATAGRDNVIHVFDIRSSSVVATLSSRALAVAGRRQMLAFYRDARYLASGAVNCSVLLWDLTSPSKPIETLDPMHGASDTVQVKRRQPGVDDPVTAIAWGPFLAAGAKLGELAFWNCDDDM